VRRTAGLIERRGEPVHWLRPEYAETPTGGVVIVGYGGFEVPHGYALIMRGKREVILPTGSIGWVDAEVRVTRETAESLLNGDIVEDSQGRHYTVTKDGKDQAVSDSYAMDAVKTELAKPVPGAFIVTVQQGGGAEVRTIQDGNCATVTTIQHGGGAEVRTIQDGGEV
jgi:hypothetical protein